MIKAIRILSILSCITIVILSETISERIAWMFVLYYSVRELIDGDTIKVTGGFMAKGSDLIDILNKNKRQ
jgi:hypothetical protein